MSRKIKAVAVQPVHDAAGELIANVGDEISEADYDRLEPGVQSVYRLVVVGEPSPAKQPDIKDAGSASDSFSVKKSGGSK